MSLLRTTVLGLLLASCATAQRPTEAALRVPDSVPERMAAQRAGAPRSLELEPNEERWGIEAARERKRQRDAAKEKQAPAETGKSVDVTTPPAR